MPRSSFSLAFLAVVALATSASAQQIIDEHIKAVGGADALAKVKTVQRTGKANLKGPFGEFAGMVEESYNLGDQKGHRLIDLGIFVLESGWTGNEGWQDGPPQGLRDMSEQELGLAKVNGSPSLLAAIKNQFGDAAFGETADASFNDKECVEIKINETPLKVYVNKESKLIEGIAVEDMVEITFDDYKEIDGVKIANKTMMNVAAQGIEMVNEYEETKFNSELDEELFKKPEEVEPETEEADAPAEADAP